MARWKHDFWKQLADFPKRIILSINSIKPKKQLKRLVKCHRGQELNIVHRHTQGLSINHCKSTGYFCYKKTQCSEGLKHRKVVSLQIQVSCNGSAVNQTGSPKPLPEELNLGLSLHWRMSHKTFVGSLTVNAGFESMSLVKRLDLRHHSASVYHRAYACECQASSLKWLTSNLRSVRR